MRIRPISILCMSVLTLSTGLAAQAPARMDTQTDARQTSTAAILGNLDDPGIEDAQKVLDGSEDQARTTGDVDDQGNEDAQKVADGSEDQARTTGDVGDQATEDTQKVADGSEDQARTTGAVGDVDDQGNEDTQKVADGSEDQARTTAAVDDVTDQGIEGDGTDPGMDDALEVDAYRIAEGDGLGLRIDGGRIHEVAILLVALTEADLARPALVLPLDRFPGDGTLMIAVDPQRVVDFPIWVRVLAVGVAPDGGVSFRATDPRRIEPQAVEQEKLLASISFEDGVWVLNMEMEVPSTGHELRLDAEDRDDSDATHSTLRLMLTLIEPGAGEIVLPVVQRLQYSFALSQAEVSGRVEIWLRREPRGGAGLPTYEKVRELDVK